MVREYLTSSVLEGGLSVASPAAVWGIIFLWIPSMKYLEGDYHQLS